ncbi:MAG: hypothetical protein QOF76_525 [Solirubrobacteraceae bacterium]|jgi:deazaflavin-dependent oxidoreductase (nitroreductase family)|nr:hypothetical protein [Solirubrobacteraceae bacterium]
MPGLRHVDPTAARGRVARALIAMSSSRLALRLMQAPIWRIVVWRTDPHLMRLTRGRVSLAGLLPVALLQTRGARTGEPRSNGVIYFHEGSQVILVASKVGLPNNPAWYYNARAHPDVELGGQPFRAETVDDEADRTRLFGLADRIYPAFASYRESAARHGRTIPILRLTPRA